MPVETSIFPTLIAELAQQLRARHWLLCSAESCTGGLIAALCTAQPGSSDWFDAGYVTYSLAAKQRLLGVSPATLAQHGAVSEPVAREMALGALAHCDAQLAVAVTGIAGPAGGEPLQPVGVIWLGWAQRPDNAPAQLIQCSRYEFSGDRQQIRQQATLAALRGLLRCLAP